MDRIFSSCEGQTGSVAALPPSIEETRRRLEWELDRALDTAARRRTAPESRQVLSRVERWMLGAAAPLLRLCARRSGA